MVEEVLDGATARRWVALAEAALGEHRHRIDALNVFPVPDGDTGTNLHLTIAQAAQAVAELPAGVPLGQVCDVIARSALLGARGNSGIITSQLLRGWADELAAVDHAEAGHVAAALQRADSQAWAAVDKPVEGTMLSVSRAAAAACRRAHGTVAALLDAAHAAAVEALEATTAQLPALTAAGVVDAGGAGVVLLIDALRAAVTGGSVRDLPALGTAVPPVQLCGEHLADGGPAYEVMFLLDAAGSSIPALRGELAEIGDSLVVVGGDGLWHVHVHVDDPGAAVEAGIRAGRPRDVRITHFATRAAQPAERPAGTVDGATAAPPPGAGDRAGQVGVVAWVAGPGLATLFSGCGVVPVVTEQGRRASTGEVLDAVRRTGAPAVVVLPNDPDTLAVARSAADTARSQGLRVTVVPTRAQVQGLAAAAVHDPAADLDQDVAAMSAAAGGTRHGAVTVAARDAITMAGPCRTGDVLGVVDGDFAVVGDDLADVALQVTTRLLSGGGEMVTLVTGQQMPPGLAETLARALRRQHPAVEVTVLEGGQPRYPLLVGVE